MENSEPWLRSWRHWYIAQLDSLLVNFVGVLGVCQEVGHDNRKPNARERLHSFNDKQVKKRIIHLLSLSSLRKACQNSLHINITRQKCQFEKNRYGGVKWRWPVTFLWGTYGWYVNLSVNVIGRKLSCYVNSPIRSCLLNPFLTNYFASEITAFTYISHRCFRHQAAAQGSSLNFCYFLL